MSILDSIQAAEADALAKKRAAATMGRDYLREAEGAATSEAEAMIARARGLAGEKVVAAEKQAINKLEELLAKRGAENDVLAEKALERLDEVADYIVGRVVS